MAKNRDDFSRADIARLERRVNGHCSNPACGVATSGPSLGKDSANCIGVAAHIAAASPGGPRYDNTQSVDERKSINNGIWLCANCATKIDKDEIRYTIDIINQWKRQAEQKAFEEIGLAPISRKSYDSLKAVVLGDLPQKNITHAVREICRLSSEELERIDPRFDVEVEYKNKKTVYTLLAKQEVNCRATVIGSSTDEFLKKFSDLLDHGTALEMSTESLTLQGSPIFDFQNGLPGKLLLTPNNKRNAVCKISVDGIERTTSLDDIKGYVTGGKKSITFTGETFDGHLSVELKLDTTGSARKNLEINLLQHYSKWKGRPLLTLPYFSRVYQFYEDVMQERCMHLTLEMDGEEVINGEGSNILEKSETRNVFRMLRYVRNIRGIAKFFGLDVAFNDELKISAETVLDVENIYNLLCELPKLRGKDIGGVKFTLIPNDPESAELSKFLLGDSGAIHIVQEFLSPLNVFGMLIELPKVNFSYSSMKTVKSLRHGDGSIEMTLEPDAECLCNVYLAEGQPHAQNS